jgi:hypothetical protein
MAIEFMPVLSCDRHLDNGGERVTGATLTVPAEDGRLVEMELCDECRAHILAAAYAAAARYGRAPDKATKDTGLAARQVWCDPAKGGCGNRYVEIRQHIKLKHPGMNPDDVAPRRRRQPSTHNPCQECGQLFDTPQGLAAHMRTHKASRVA